ncbi:MAG: hypothetical protein HY835_12980, partial [Anaerolineae bacterium]|nr:hypothetical protein [Anaerolineae bacterium]
MSRRTLFITLTLALLSITAFALTLRANTAGSDNIAMLAVFQPDEAVPLPYVFDMIRVLPTLKETLYNFAFYEYYFYGFPYFAVSALLLIPVKLAGQLDNIPLVMGLLRQAVSVLPVLLSILLVVYLQTGFRTWKAVPLFLILVALPAVVENNLWWHPDALAILLILIALFFLERDQLRLGRGFYLSAAFAGFSAGTKGIGFYFFLAVGTVLLMALIHKKAGWRRLILSALGYLLVMAFAYLVANPILVYPDVRRAYFGIMERQSELLRLGYEVEYARGLAAAWPDLTAFYGTAPFLLLGCAAAVWGALRGPRRLLDTLIIAWSIPILVLIFGIIHFKFQYALPVALPLLSCLVHFFPDGDTLGNLRPTQALKTRLFAALQALTALVLAQQFAFFAQNAWRRIDEETHKVENSPNIQFYDEIRTRLAPLIPGSYRVYQDVRVYLPPVQGWETEGIYETLDYDYIQAGDFDILLLMQQRIYDYLNPAVTAIDADRLARARVFYLDANLARLQGYKLIFRDSFGLIYVRDELAEK